MAWDAVRLPLACCILGTAGTTGGCAAGCARPCSGTSARTFANVGWLAVPRLCPGQRHTVQLRGLLALGPADGVRGRSCHTRVGSQWAAAGQAGADPLSDPARVGLGAGGWVAACRQWGAEAPQEHGGGGAACPCAARPASVGAPRRRGWASSQVRPLPAPAE